MIDGPADAGGDGVLGKASQPPRGRHQTSLLYACAILIFCGRGLCGLREIFVVECNSKKTVLLKLKSICVSDIYGVYKR